jgi:hypothetical protein
MNTNLNEFNFIFQRIREVMKIQKISQKESQNIENKW